jgi:hypothetical protein
MLGLSILGVVVSLIGAAHALLIQNYAVMTWALIALLFALASGWDRRRLVDVEAYVEGDS